MRAAWRTRASLRRPTTRTPARVALYRLAAQALAAATSQEADACDRGIAAALAAMLAPDDAPRLAALFANVPSSDVYRHLWRALARVTRERPSLRRAFAIPVVVVAAAERSDTAGTTLPASSTTSTCSCR
jgi:hypothetical protein